MKGIQISSALGLALSMMVSVTWADTPAHVRNVTPATDPLELAIKQQLPAGSNLQYIFPQQHLGDKVGTVALFRTGKGYTIWLVTDSAGHNENIVVRRPESTDDYYDMFIKQVFSVGAEQHKDLVILETYSTPLSAGSERFDTGSVYRLDSGKVSLLIEQSDKLYGITTESEARHKLETHQ